MFLSRGDYRFNELLIQHERNWKVAGNCDTFSFFRGFNYSAEYLLAFQPVVEGGAHRGYGLVIDNAVYDIIDLVVIEKGNLCRLKRKT